MENVFFLVGPTAAGKHELAVEIARKFGLEIISIDAFKVYKYMDIGTAKPSPELMKEIPHHLVSIVDPQENYSAGKFVGDTNCVLQNKTKRFLAVGGTFLYYKALVYGIFQSPPSDPQIRSELLLHDAKLLYEKLEKIDPESAQRLHPNDKKRVARAIEVFRITGKKLSSMQTHFTRQREEIMAKAICLVRSKDQIKERITTRIDKMLKLGLVEEVKNLKDRPLSVEARNAICYREFLDHLDGKLSYEEAIEKSKKRSLELVRKQLTWIKSLPELRVIDSYSLSSKALYEKAIAELCI